LVQIREAELADAPQLAHFSCANPNEKWTRAAETVIRADVATDLFTGCGLRVLVAVVADEVIGVVAFGAGAYGHAHIHVLAVRHAYRRNGVATRLKQQVITTCGVVTSQVHRRNFAMQNLNAKLNAETAPDPADGELLVTVTNSPDA
jgi:GNAT superfamily N-acetyltransferase